MLSNIGITSRSNHDIFQPQNSGSPFNDVTEHISSLGLRRLDFERGAVAGEVIYTIEGDSAPVSQQDEEARIATLAHALKKLGNSEDAAEFMRCLNAICEEGDARYRQVLASYYYGEIAERGAGVVLKDMALIAMQIASINPVTEEAEDGADVVYALCGESKPRSLFDREVAAVERMIRGRRKSAGFTHDESTEWLNDLEANGASLKELDDAFAHVEALDQYDEGGAIVRMSAHERAVACGRVDPEFSAEDLPERARHLAGELRDAYVSGIEIERIRDEINAEIELIFPASARPANGGWFYSHANRELQRFTRQALEAILDECERDFHHTAQRNNRAYRRFYKEIRRSTDIRTIGELMKQAYVARQDGEISIKNFIALNAAADNQRERLLSAPLSAIAYQLIEEIVAAPEKKLGYLAWAMYGGNQPSHRIHALPSCEQTRVWEVLTARKAAILLPRICAKSLTTWGRALPAGCFLFLAAFKEFLELPRLRKAVNTVHNKQRASVKRASSASKPTDQTRGQSVMKRGAVVSSRSRAASCGRQ